MNMQQLSYFLMVSKTLNFTRAAEQLFVSQSSLSMQIAAMEKELGCRLCTRTTRSVKLTPAGKHLAKVAQEILDRLEQIPHELALVQEGKIGRIDIGFAFGTQQKLSQIIACLREAHPQIQLVPHYAKDIHQMLSMEQGGLDAVLLCEPCIRGMEWIGSCTIERSGLSVLVPSAHSFAGRTCIGIEELAGERILIFPRPQIPRYYDTLISELRPRGIVPAEYVHVSDSESIAPQVAAGLGTALIPDFAASMPGEGVRAVPIAQCRSGYDLVLAYIDSTSNPSILLLCDLISIDCLE